MKEYSKRLLCFLVLSIIVVCVAPVHGQSIDNASVSVNVSNANVGSDRIGHATITVTVASIYLPLFYPGRLLVGLAFSSSVNYESKLLYANGTATSSPDPCNSTMIESQAGSLAVCVTSTVAFNSTETVSFNLNQPGIDKGVQYTFVALAMDDSFPGIISGPTVHMYEPDPIFGGSHSLLLNDAIFTITFT